MHSFLILTLSFAGMCGYLEWATHQADEQSASMTGFTKVIREQAQADSAQARLEQAVPEQEVALTTIETPLPFNPQLNLSIPLADTHSETLSFETNSTSWFEANQDQKVEYDAELLFDSKEGNTIRGGQLSITIPLG